MPMEYIADSRQRGRKPRKTARHLRIRYASSGCSVRAGVARLKEVPGLTYNAPLRPSTMAPQVIV